MPMSNNSLFGSTDTVNNVDQHFPHSGLVVESSGTFSDRHSKARHKTKRKKYSKTS